MFSLGITPFATNKFLAILPLLSKSHVFFFLVWNGATNKVIKVFFLHLLEFNGLNAS